MDRAQLYAEFLEQEGYRPKVDEDGDVVFKVEGGTYIISVDPDDVEYVQIVYPGFWSLDNDDDRAKALLAASDANRSCKCAKVFLTAAGDDTIATIEFFAPTVEQACDALPRAIRALRFVVKTFAKQMNGED